MQAFSSSRDSAPFGHYPEVMQVAEVNHAGQSLRKKRMINKEYSTFFAFKSTLPFEP